MGVIGRDSPMTFAIIEQNGTLQRPNYLHYLLNWVALVLIVRIAKPNHSLRHYA